MKPPIIKRLHRLLAPHAWTAIMAGALFCTLAAKLYHCLRVGIVAKYPLCVIDDVAFILGMELVFTLVCLKYPRRWVVRGVTLAAALICTWSVMNAGWLIRTGTQILPSVLLPLVRDPVNAFLIIGVSFAKMPIAAVVLLAPSAVALTFFFCVMVHPQRPSYNRRRLIARSGACLVMATAAMARGAIDKPHASTDTIADRISFNSQLRALSIPWADRPHRIDPQPAIQCRRIPTSDDINLGSLPAMGRYNLVVVVLEGVQYQYTSLAESSGSGYLRKLAAEGAEFTQLRTTLTHTTKVLFSLMTGRYPSFRQDLAETVPAEDHYASIATILGRNGYSTAFFQSAKGNFECRPGLVWNLGFDHFASREELCRTEDFVGYLGCDEFSLLEPVIEWIRSADGPFLVVLLCSVTHDPYEVPKWFATPAREPIQRYRQSIEYTEAFIESLDIELTKLGLTENTIFCVVGDHGEAFGEHGLHAHERIGFDEALRVPWVIRAPGLVTPGIGVTGPASSIDFAPTVLSLMGLDIGAGHFDGTDSLAPIPAGRRIHFFGWLEESPAGFVESGTKFIYDPITGEVFVYDIENDPLEIDGNRLDEQQADSIACQIRDMRRRSFIKIDRQDGEKLVFDRWLCRWNNRVSTAKYRPAGD